MFLCDAEYLTFHLGLQRLPEADLHDWLIFSCDSSIIVGAKSATDKSVPHTVTNTLQAMRNVQALFPMASRLRFAELQTQTCAMNAVAVPFWALAPVQKKPCEWKHSLLSCGVFGHILRNAQTTAISFNEVSAADWKVVVEALNSMPACSLQWSTAPVNRLHAHAQAHIQKCTCQAEVAMSEDDKSAQ